ncbi:MAG TPA: ARMT1-like domain-containing protein, partial [Phycisphaerae bacterium]|nr:ARMT1-like domain-containing protein [Phycisphaerae bacterium]
FTQRLLHGPRHKQAMFFCDNSGPDIILGVIPFCRWLAQRGTRVLIAANRLPALNDITFPELQSLLPRLQALDPTLDALVKSNRLAPLDSGNAIPLIDLRHVSAAVNRHAPDTDLLILEGMGRAVETNLTTRFSVDALKLAMIKDEMVAKRRGGKNFDTICRFDPA